MSASLEVLHVHSGNMFGGVESLLITLARHQNAEPNTHHSFALCFKGLLSERLSQEGSTPVSLGAVRAGRPWTVLRARSKLRNHVEANDPSIVVCHAPWALAMLGPAVRDMGKPLVYWQHGITQRDTWVERLAARTHPDLAIANSEFTARSVPNIFPDTVTEVLYCPVEPPDSTDLSEGAAVRDEIGTGSDSIVIIQVSRMEAWKGHRLHLEALGRLRNLNGWECWIVGGAQRVERLFQGASPWVRTPLVGRWKFCWWKTA